MMVKGISTQVIKWCLLGCCIFGLALTGCSGDDQEMKDPVEESEDEGESAGEEAYTEDEGYGEDDEYSDAVEETAQEVLNEAPSDDDAEPGAAESLEGIMNGAPTDSATELGDDATGYEDDMVESDSEGMESLKSSGMDSGITDTSGSDMPAVLPTGTSRVFFVRVPQANLRQGPGTNSATTGSLVQGDSVVATVNGDWAQLSNGTYISANLLSAEPVGRQRTPNSWTSER